MAAVLLGAALHAAWNVAIRAGGDRRRETALLAGASALIAAVGLPLVRLPAPAAWPHAAISMVLHTVYYALLAEAYTHGGVALAYPLMRGTAPMLTTLGAWALLGERLSPIGWAGIGGICAGVVLLARHRGGAQERAAVLFALANAVVIAGYTVNDAIGARVSDSPVGYALVVFVLSAAPTLLWLRRFGVLRAADAAGGTARFRRGGVFDRRLRAGAVGDDAGRCGAGGGAARDGDAVRPGAGPRGAGRAARRPRLGGGRRHRRRRGGAATGVG